MKEHLKRDWVEQISDNVERHVERIKGASATIICASGISPSGPVHLGNLREVMTVHLVAEELRIRGRQVRHLHFWDDYDRLRKIPAGVSAAFSRYLGYPLTNVPDPFGTYESYALRYISEFTSGLEQLGIVPEYIRQASEYRRGTYTAAIKTALAHRGQIFDILAEYQTRQSQQEAQDERRAQYYPYRVYCQNCQKDETAITAYEEASATLTYSCQACGFQGSSCLDQEISGKLVWKVDWPMRWSVQQVDFEPAGEDHAAPGSSFTVGHRVIQAIYHSPPPQYVGYAFVGMDGRSKISSSQGTAATLASALEIVEPSILRWLYTRRTYNQTFNVDYGQGLLRLYDEWDAMTRQVKAGKVNENNQKAYTRAISAAQGNFNQTPQPVPFSLLTSILDVTQGNSQQVLRIAAQYVGRALRQDELEPRLTCASQWVERYLPDDERTQIRPSFAAQTYAQLSEQDRAGIDLLATSLESAQSLEELTTLVYNIPKLVRGLPSDTTPDNELKQAQRSFFIALYSLICGSDTGPRIPTLLLSLGEVRVKALLSGTP